MKVITIGDKAYRVTDKQYFNIRKCVKAHEAADNSFTRDAYNDALRKVEEKKPLTRLDDGFFYI